jgi:arylsulfatase A-like enzyme
LKDFVSLVDLAPTFLDAAGAAIPKQMSGKSLLPILLSRKADRVDHARNHIVFGKERHVPAQLAPSIAGYPCRGIRTDQYMYIRNFAPDRWPAGVPEGASHPMGKHADCDKGPTKAFLMKNKDDKRYKRYYDLSFAKRPAEELYDMVNDPYQLKNLAGDTAYKSIKDRLSAKLTAVLTETKDPRVIGGGEKFDEYPYRSRYKLNRGTKSI